MYESDNDWNEVRRGWIYLMITVASDDNKFYTNPYNVYLVCMYSYIQNELAVISLLNEKRFPDWNL